MKSFVVDFWSRIFRILSWVSVFHLLKVTMPSIKQPGAVEAWVLANLAASVFVLQLSDAAGWAWWELALVVYAALRIFEVVVYQMNVLLFDAYRVRKAGGTYKLRGFRRLIILLLHNYAELVFWFAILYRHMSEAFTPAANSAGQALAISFNGMSGLGEAGSQVNAETAAALALQLQAVVGLLMAMLVLAQFISLIPQPDTADDIERTERE